MATSPNYAWAEPDNSSLVKNGASDIRTLGDAIDTSVWNVGFGQAGKNKIINGDFGIWQRGTSFSNPSTTAYTADRFLVEHDGAGATRTISQQTFTPATAPVAGYEGTYFLQYAVSGGTSNTYQQIEQRIENVRTFAGQTVTFSFWAKADAARTIDILVNRNFGSGGSTADQSSVGSTLNITTSWARYSVTGTMGSVSGKTIGAGSYLQWIMRFAAATAQTVSIWGVQLEYGSKATPFQTASGGSPQAELAMCQRYYERWSLETSNIAFAGFNNSTTNGYHTWHFHTKKRSEPTISVSAAGDFSVRTPAGNQTCTAFTTIGTTTDGVWMSTTVASGLTSGNGNFLVNSGASSFIQASSEL